MDEQLLREFLAEAEDLIETLYGQLAALRARRTEGRARRDLVGHIFRHVHTIKGSAAAAGLQATSALAHEFETLLDGVRLGRVRVDRDVLDAFEAAVGAVAANLSAVARGRTEAGVPAEVVERLRRLASAGARATGEGGVSAVLAALPGALARALGEHERQRLREAVGEGARVYVVAVEFGLATFDEEFRALGEALAAVGEVVATLPGVDASAPDRIGFQLLYATPQERGSVAALAAPFGATLLDPPDAGRGGAAGTDEARGEGARADDDDESAARVDEEAGGEAGVRLPAASAASLTMLVRVPLDELDELISATHELLGDTAGALDLALSGGLGRAERTELEIRAPRIRRRFVELEERLIELRMVPVRQTLERAARAGSTVARASGKEVDFEVVGGEVRLDKSLAERVADPLLHLLRNAVDHGLETADERRLAGKPERGRVRLEAEAEGSRVMLRVSDDGRGIDPEHVARAARERGVVPAGARVTEQQALRLIFRPGFSTARELSSLSGRGVGLDVVEQAVEQAGGEVRVWSRRGAGTTFEMRLPTTLALVSSLVVRSSGQRYCVDVSHMVEAGLAERGDTAREGAARFVLWRGARLPLVSLRDLLGQEPPPENGGDGRVHIVISRRAARRGDEGEGRDEAHVAVAVDGWDGHREVLVRGLGRHATRWRGVSGATELNDGEVALMLDLPRLLEMNS